MKISAILDQIDLGAIALPEFQRGFVWNREQVKGLVNSLYRRYPVGGLLVWVTRTELVTARGDGKLEAGSVRLLLDGQQRITSLYGIVRGKPPAFFDGNRSAFTNLFFNLRDQVFEFYAPLKMKDDPFWIDVTQLMKLDIGPFVAKVIPLAAPQDLTAYINRLTAVRSIQDVELHIEEVTGDDKTVGIVVDIFNQVNSGGTKLSKADLALAKVCAQWPQAREEMKIRFAKWRRAGFSFRLEWLLRNVNAVMNGEALFEALERKTTVEFQANLERSEQLVDTLINLIAGRLGLDHDLVLRSPFSIPVMARYLKQHDGHLPNQKEQDKLLYWYIHTILWGRYAGSTESVLNQDLHIVVAPDGGLDQLIAQLRSLRGDLRIRPSDFRDWSVSARFYPLLYMLTRVYHAKDWESGIELSNHLLGHLSRLEIHHIFPKARLYKHGYSRPEVNAIANFTFLTQQTNLLISDADPSAYLERFEERNPGVVASHWIPMDRHLWKVENYREFLEARRELLAKAANSFLDSLLSGANVASAPMPTVLRTTERTPHIATSADDSDDIQVVCACNAWMIQHDLPPGEPFFELVDPDTNALLSMLDLAWPRGIQEGASDPVALLLAAEPETRDIVRRAGYRYFTDLSDLKTYVRRDVLALA